MSVESNVVFALALLYFTLSDWLTKLAPLSDNQSEVKPKPIVTC